MEDDSGKVTKYQKYETVTIPRGQINFAYYNPRKISDENKKNFRDVIKEVGIIEPVIWNKRTGNLVGGHQRLSVLDGLHRNINYSLTVAEIDVDEETEAKINIILNNPNLQGEWDAAKLAEIKEIYPQISFLKDLKFNQIDLQYFQHNEGVKFFDMSEQAGELSKISEKNYDKINEARKQHRERMKQMDSNSDGAQWTEHNDFNITFVFNSNKDKQDFLERIGKSRNEKYLKYTVLYDLAQGKFNNEIFS